MDKEKLVEQIELIRQRLVVNRKKLVRQATDPNRQTLAAMYKLLVKDIKADELEMTRLTNELTALENPVWRKQDALLADRLKQFLRYWHEIKDEQVWDERQLKSYTNTFRKRLVTARNLLAPDNRHLHAYVNQQLAQTEKAFTNWCQIQKEKMSDYGAEYRRWLKLPESLDQRIEHLQTELGALLLRTPSSLRELVSWHTSMEATINETGDWIEDKYFTDARRRLPTDKQDGVDRLFKTIDTKLHEWNMSHRNQVDQLPADAPAPEKQTRDDPASPKSNFIIIKVLWKDVTFKDKFIDVLASFSISQVYHHINYALRFDGSRRSFQAFAPILDTLGLEPLEVQVNVKDRSIVKVLNAHVLTELIGFLAVKETFDWLEWDVYRGSPQRININYTFAKYPGLNRHECLRHLASLQSPLHRIIFVKEYASASESNRSSTASDAFLFTVDQGSSLFIIWENEVNSLATYVFKTTSRQYYTALQCLYDYVSSQVIQAKRMRLRENDLQTMKGSIHKCQFIIHDDLRDWRRKLSRSLR